MDYSDYRFSPYELMRGILEYLVLCTVTAYFFYRSMTVFIVLVPGVFIYLGFYRKRLIKARKRKLVTEFSETLNSVSSGLRAGYSLENAFIEAEKDMIMFYGENSLMASEISLIRMGLRLNKTIEELMADLGLRSGAEEILLFSDVLKCAKRNGGNVTEVLSETAGRIRERICVDNEIQLLITEKKLELRIMQAVPFFILVYLEITSAGYYDVLYEGYKGRLIMSFCLGLYIVAGILGERIMRISL